jgi:hypothetical protein
MIYIITCTKGNSLYVCAVSESEAKIHAYDKKIDESLNPTMISIWNASLPIFIIEDEKNFNIENDPNAIEKRIKKLKKKKRIELGDNYFTFWEINKEFFTKPIGEDKMGALDHTHVDNKYIRRMKNGKQ